MFHDFNLYELFVLSFVQLVLSTVLVLSPARQIGSRFKWTGSRVTEVTLASLIAVAVSAVSCLVAAELWGLGTRGLESAAYMLSIFSIVVIVMRPDTNVVGQVFYASFVAADVVFLVFAALVAVDAKSSITETITSSLLIVFDLVALVIWSSAVGYASDVLARTRHSRPDPVVDPSYRPMVSIHIPAYNEPPQLLIDTISAAEQIDYPDFEIVVMDNNTKDQAVWGPVEEYCRYRPRVRFVHVDPWPGYKAGACNLALRSYTDPRAEIIAMVDADDIVQPHYLKETVAHFSDPNLGFVQTCEGNRDYQGSAYYTACVDSYQSFYLAVMSSRNERDSVPFVGTMGLIRRSALEGIGGWNEWCISEDTEASLRVLKAGWSGLYIPRCFGRGIVPPTFAGLNTQRHRWCFGAMQILRLHWRSLMPWDSSPDNHLTQAQRRDYFMASMSWFRDLLMLGFALILLVTTGLILSGSTFTLMLLGGDRSLLPLSLMIVATVCITWTLRLWSTITRKRAALSLLISLSASLITAFACIAGLLRREGVFLRTSKTGASHHRVRSALRLVRWETALAASLFLCAALLATRSQPPKLLLFVVCVQGLVFACGPIASLWNLYGQTVPAAEYRRRHQEQQLRRLRKRPSFVAGRVAAAVVVAVVVGAATAALAAPANLADTGPSTSLPHHAGSASAGGAVTPKSPTTTVPLRPGDLDGGPMTPRFDRPHSLRTG